MSGSAANAPSARTVTESDGWAFELKWDGFRAIVSTENGLRFVAGAAGTGPGMSRSSGISRVGWYDERGRGLMMIAALTDKFELSSN